jgi:UDP-N-acetylmuramoyl-L-alanyl-D-glutamate--2,6-diaminopimelate ligase
VDRAGIDADVDVSSICFDSRELKPGCIFVAIRGEKSDGHSYLTQAAKLASALIVEDVSKVPSDYRGTVFQTAKPREILNKLAARFYSEPSREMFMVGITGTNGKTTTANIIEAVLSKGGMPTGVIGTIDHHLGQRIWPTDRTTPDPVSFQQRLREFKNDGAKATVLEVTSHALVQSRTDEVEFDVAVFTNLTRDHLDYHLTMENYFQAKNKLFSELLVRSSKARPTAVVNCDDDYGRKLSRGKGVRFWSYGVNQDADFHATIRTRGFSGTTFDLKTPIGAHVFKTAMPGRHNVYNAVSAIAVGAAAGISLQTSAEALLGLRGVSGRLESVPNEKGLHVFVDYAHTDDALKTVLYFLNEIRQAEKIRNRIITVFGCGGDRDKGKRPIMMRVAEAASDIVVVTSDNPRTENPEAIVDDILKGASSDSIGKTVLRETDRREGIRKALELAAPGDVVLIAGKGHETYQEVGTTRFLFNDFEIVQENLK